MDPLKLKNATRKDVGASQGFVPLNLRDDVVKDSGTGGMYLSLACAFRPTPEELTQMLNGAPVILRILTGQYNPDLRHQKLGSWPPVELYVDPNEEVES